MCNDLDIYNMVGEPVAVLRKRYLIICENDYCAAMLLDIFCAREATAMEYAQCEYEYDPYITTSIKELAEKLFSMFSPDAVQDALSDLIDKRYIKISYNKDDREEYTIQEIQIRFVCIPPTIEEAC